MRRRVYVVDLGSVMFWIFAIVVALLVAKVEYGVTLW